MNGMDETQISDSTKLAKGHGKFPDLHTQIGCKIHVSLLPGPRLSPGVLIKRRASELARRKRQGVS